MREFLPKSSFLLVFILFFCIRSEAQVTCNFTLVDTVGCMPFAISATATNTTPAPYTITARRWYLTGPQNFTTPLGANPTFGYIPTIPGTYCLRLWARNSNNDTCSFTRCNIIVADTPTINFVFAPKEACAPLTITATCNSTPGSGTIDTLIIDWGCGTNETFYSCPTTPIVHPYTNCFTGCISPTVVAYNTYGCNRARAYPDEICFIPKPIANFTGTPTTVNCATGPQTVNFTADSAGANMTYKWYVYNNGILEATQFGPSNLFSYPFPVNQVCYDVALKVEHATGGSCSDSLMRAAYVCIRPQPVISFTQNVTTACVRPGSPATLTFTNTSAGTPTMTWNLSGGGQTFPQQTGNNPSFTITNTGTYTVTVTGSFGTCNTVVTQQALVANLKPTAGFTQSDSASCKVPFQVIYTPTPLCAGCTYNWSLAGVGNQTGSPTTATYNSFGPPSGYSASLTVVAPNGCTDTRLVPGAVKVNKLVPRMAISKSMGCAPVCGLFDNTTPINVPGDSITTVCWTFPGSTIPAACKDTIQRCFTTVGTYSVKMVVTSLKGCTDSIQYIDTIKVGAAPVCAVTATPTSMCFEADSVCFTLTCDTFDFARVDYGDGVTEIVYTSNFCHMYQDTGFFRPMIIAYNDSCKGDTLQSIDIEIFSPVAKFKDSVACGAGSIVHLKNQYLGPGTFMWYFCNGDSSSALHPSISLPPCDTCLVTLVVTHPTNGCVHQKTLPVVPPCSSPDFTPKDTVGCAPFFVNFKNISLQKDPSFTRFRVCGGPICDFGNNSCVKAGDSVTHTYNAPGVYNICMRNRAGNCVDLVQSTVRVCDINGNFSPTSVCYPLPVNFQDLSTDLYCGGAVTWSWRFNDGSPVDTAKNPVHVFPAPGSYQVSLVVTNSVGCTDSVVKTVTVAPVNISYKIDSVICPGKQGCVVNTSTGAGLTYSLIIPNALPNDTFTTINPCYSFAAPGDYPAYLHISAGGQCDFYDTVIIHNRAPEAGGYISDDYIPCPNPPTFILYYDTSKYSDSTTTWLFGDGGTSALDTSQHIYTMPDSYPVTVIAISKDGCISTRVIDTVVVDGPYGDFGFSPPGMCSCKDEITYTINTVKATTINLLYGCNAGSSYINPITPVGTDANPTTLTFTVPYCLTDSCQPQLIFGDASGCQVYMDGNFAYIDSPVVAMGFDNYGVCVQGTVCFQDLTTYTLPPFRSYTVERFWDFGDGSPLDTSANPCHYYDTVGGYNVKLYIRSNWGCFDSIVSNIVIIPEFPIAGFYPDDSLVCANAPMCFHDTSTIYPLTVADYWVVDFGDGSIDTFQTPDFCHVYDTGGYYRVTMCVYDSIGCPDCDSSVVIRVIDNPIANAAGDRTVCYGIVTQLNGTGGSIPQWEPAGLFSNPNSYNPTVQLFNDTTVTFYVGDQYGCRDTDQAVLTVAQVFADFTVGASYCEKVPVCVTDASTVTNGTLSTWVYDFGDGFTQMGPDTCHSYQVFGTLPITEIVTDNNGCKDTVTKTVNILPSPDAEFSLNDTVICSDQALCVSDLTTSTVPLTSWQWYYGSVYTSTSPTPPCYTFTAPYSSTYNIVLVVIDQNTCRDTAQITVNLNVVPVANFDAPAACETDLLQFTNTSSSPVGLMGCEWLFWVGAPNPVTSNVCNASYQFPAGNYPVQLVVTDVNGCKDTIVKTVLSDTISQLVITPGDTTLCIRTAVAYSVSGVFDNVVWTPNVWIDNPNSSNVLITPLSNITYIISATNGVCTAASDTFSIRILQEIPIEVMATPEQVVLGLNSTITSQIGGQIDSIIWSPDATLDCRECPNPIALPTQTTTYYATIYYSENGITCSNMDSVTIVVLATCDQSIIYLPNTFTPNGDGLNDYFMIRGLAATRINHFRVFDRWGKLVFETESGEPNEPKWGWDGTEPGGEKLNSAVYVYTYEIECINGDIVTGQGNVTLLR